MNQSINQPTNQRINHSINQSKNQGINQSINTVHLQAFSERFAEIRTRNLGNRDACTEFIPL